MEFNPNKCGLIHVTRSRTPAPRLYLLHGQFLELVVGSSYLGVEISNNLSFNSHVQNVTTSARLPQEKNNVRKSSIKGNGIETSYSHLSGVVIIT